MSDSRCKVCQHPSRSAIESAIISGRSNISVAGEWGLSKDSVRRHRGDHLAPAMRGALASAEGRAGRTALNRLESIYSRAEAILDAAEQGGQGSLALSAIRELRGLVELLAKLTGELDERPQVTVNVLQTPEWVGIQQTILAALATFPDARVAVAHALTAGDVIAGELVP